MKLEYTSISTSFVNHSHDVVADFPSGSLTVREQRESSLVVRAPGVITALLMVGGNLAMYNKEKDETQLPFKSRPVTITTNSSFLSKKHLASSEGQLTQPESHWFEENRC